MHNDPMDIVQHIPKECVPSDLGGCDKSIQELGGMCGILKYKKCFKI